MPKQSINFASSVSGIPCGIHIDTYHPVSPFKGSPFLCDSDWDFHGYTDIEYTILDRKGYSAAWLERKLSPVDNERILEEITAHEQEEFFINE